MRWRMPLRRLQTVWWMLRRRNRHRVRRRLGLQLQLLLVVGILPPLLMSSDLRRPRRFNQAWSGQGRARTGLIEKPFEKCWHRQVSVREPDSDAFATGECLPYDGDPYR